MKLTLVTVSATIPEDSLSHYYTFIAGLHEGTSEVVSVDAIKHAYLGGRDNEPWRRLLRELAKRGGDEVHWPDLCGAVGYGRRTMSGVIGAGERRCKENTPYTKRYSGDDTWFTMRPDVAQIILDLAEEVGDNEG